MPGATSEPLIVLDVNGEPPTAYINLGSSNVLLSPETELSLPLYDCAVDERFRSVWVSATHELKIIAKISRPGQKACSLTGIASVTWEDHMSTKPVTGSCDC